MSLATVESRHLTRKVFHDDVHLCSIRAMATRVGIRELQQHASKVVAYVKRGERVEVTERGRLVAILAPPTPADRAYDELVGAGVLVPGSGGLADWQTPAGQPGIEPLSTVLAQMRDEDDR